VSAEHGILLAEYSEGRNILRMVSAVFQSILSAEYSTQDVSRILEYSASRIFYVQEYSASWNILPKMSAKSRSIPLVEYSAGGNILRCADILSRIFCVHEYSTQDISRISEYFANGIPYPKSLRNFRENIPICYQSGLKFVQSQCKLMFAALVFPTRARILRDTILDSALI
jgi:hypothetical protein